MKLTSYIYGLLIVSVCILTVYGFLQDAAANEHYDLDVDTQYLGLYNYSDKISADFNRTTYDLQRISGDEDSNVYEEVRDAIIVGKNIVLGGVSGFIGSITIGFDLLSITAQFLPVPDYFLNIMVAFLIVAIFSIVFYIIVGRRA